MVDLEEADLVVLGTASLLSLGLEGDTAPFCVRDGDLSRAGDAGESELEEVEEVAARLFGLRSLSSPSLEVFFLETSCGAGLCLDSFAAGVWRGLAGSPGLSRLLLSAG